VRSGSSSSLALSRTISTSTSPRSTSWAGVNMLASRLGRIGVMEQGADGTWPAAIDVRRRRMTRTKRDLHISFGNFIKSQFFSNNEVWAELAGLRRFYNSGNTQLSQAQNQNIGYNRIIRA